MVFIRGGVRQGSRQCQLAPRSLPLAMTGAQPRSHVVLATRVSARGTPTLMPARVADAPLWQAPARLHRNARSRTASLSLPSRAIIAVVSAMGSDQSTRVALPCDQRARSAWGRMMLASSPAARSQCERRFTRTRRTRLGQAPVSHPPGTVELGRPQPWPSKHGSTGPGVIVDPDFGLVSAACW